MTCLCWLMLAILGDLPQAQVETLKSGVADGVIEKITPSAVTVGGKTVPLNDVVEIRFPAPSPLPAADKSSLIEVILNDGSLIYGIEASVKGSDLSLQTKDFGKLTIRKNLVKSLRLAAADPKLDDSWRKMADRESKKDLIIVRKDDKLDFVAGVSGEIDAANVKFLLDGEEVPVKREKAYGLVFPTVPVTGKVQSIVDLLGDQRLQARQLTLQGDKAQVVLTSGLSLSVPVTQLRTIDFSLGKIQQLSSLKPVEVQFTPYFEDVPGYYNYQKNNGPLRTPISIGGQLFAKGLSVHSKTKLTFRLPGEYRRFQATVGIDDQSDDTGLMGDVVLKISGDDKVLFEAPVKGPDEPKKVDLDITGVRDLQILVDYGGDLDTADWLSMGDAKILK